MFEWFRKWFSNGNAADGSNVTKSSSYQPLTKYYIFNETGNIMLCTSEKSISGSDEDIKNSFIDVTVFFTAMSKAIHTTINPKTDKPYSIYNYQAVKNILLSSGMFVEVNVEQSTFQCNKVGESMGKNFIECALNRNFGDSGLHFSRAMFNGMRYQRNLKPEQIEEGDGIYFRGGSIFFICEILMGIPQTTAVLLCVEPDSEKDEKAVKKGLNESISIFDLGAKSETSHKNKNFNRTWKFKKRSYLFVPPKFLSSNSAALTKGDSAELEALVEKFRESLPQKEEQ